MLTKRFTMLFMALSMLLGVSVVQPQAVDAAKMFDSWKTNRIFGPSLHFFAEMDIVGSRAAKEVEKAIRAGEFSNLDQSSSHKWRGDEPLWYRQNQYFSPVPGTNVISATLPYDVGIRPWFIVMGHSGEHAKPKDKVNLSIWYMDATTNGWIRLAHQSSDDQGDLPEEQRWGGALTCYIPPEKLPLGTFFLKADTDNNTEPRIMQFNRTTWRLSDMFLSQIGAVDELSLLPAWDEQSQLPSTVTQPSGEAVTPNSSPQAAKGASPDGSTEIQFIAPPTAAQGVVPAKQSERTKGKKETEKPKSGQQTKK